MQKKERNKCKKKRKKQTKKKQKGRKKKKKRKQLTIVIDAEWADWWRLHGTDVVFLFSILQKVKPYKICSQGDSNLRPFLPILQQPLRVIAVHRPSTRLKSFAKTNLVSATTTTMSYHFSKCPSFLLVKKKKRVFVVHPYFSNHKRRPPVSFQQQQKPNRFFFLLLLLFDWHRHHRCGLSLRWLQCHFAFAGRNDDDDDDSFEIEVRPFFFPFDELHFFSGRSEAKKAFSFLFPSSPTPQKVTISSSSFLSFEPKKRVPSFMFFFSVAMIPKKRKNKKNSMS